MSLRLILARHGNTFEANETPVMVGRTDLALTQKGRDQAKAIGESLNRQGVAPTASFSGNLKRQTESLTIIGQQLPITPSSQIEAALNEIDYGPWEGLTVEAVEAKWPNEYHAWTKQGIWQNELFHEPFEERIESLRQWLWRLQSEFKDGKTVMCVSSQGIIRLFLYFVPNLWKTLSDNATFSEYKIKTGHYCDLSLKGESISPNGWNLAP